MFKIWLDGFKYIAPQARNKVLWNHIGTILRIIIFTPIFIIIAILHIPIVLICVLFFRMKLEDFNLLNEIFSSFKNIKWCLYENWTLSYRCSICHEKVNYGMLMNEIEIRQPKLDSVFDFYDPKNPICSNCQSKIKNKQGDKDEL